MGFRNRLTSAAVVDTGGSAPGVKVYATGNNPGAGVVEWDAYTAKVKASLFSSLTGSGGSGWTVALTGTAIGDGPTLKLSVEPDPVNGGYLPVAAIGGAPLTVAGLKGLAYARLRMTSNTAGGAGVWVTLPMQVADLDSHAGWTNGSRWTVPAGQSGIYDLSGEVVYAANAANPTHNARLLINGAVFPGCAGTGAALGTADGVAAGTSVKVVQLNVGDFVELQGYGSASWSTTNYPDAAPNLEILRVR